MANRDNRKNKHNRGGFKSIGSQVGSDLGGHLSKQGKLKGGGNKGGNFSFGDFGKFVGNFFTKPGYAQTMGDLTGNLNQLKEPSAWKIKQFADKNIDITKMNKSFRVDIDTQRAINKIENEKVRNWLNKYAPQSVKDLKINHQMYSPTKVMPGDKGYNPTGTGSIKLDPETERYLEWVAKTNPTGMTKKDAEKLYANQIAEGLSLEDAMRFNKAETGSYYALIDDTPTKNESLKVNNTKENKNMSEPLTLDSKKKTTSNAVGQNQTDVNALYEKYLGRPGDFQTTGGASYWSDKVGTAGHSLAEIENALIKSQEGQSFLKDGKVRIGGLDSSASTYGQGTGDNVWAGHFQPGGALEGGSSAFTANQIANNTGQVPNFFQASDADLAGLGGGGGTVDQPVTTQPVTDPLPTTPDPAKDKGGMDDFMKFMMLMSVMGGGRGFGGGGGGYGGSQFGYGGLNPGGVQAAYNPLEHLQGMGDWFKNNFGSGVQGGTTLTT